jgi:hypothetical protein
MQDAGEAALWPELGHCVCGELSREEVIFAVSGGDEMTVEQMLAGSIWPRCVVCGLCEQTRLDELWEKRRQVSRQHRAGDLRSPSHASLLVRPRQR